MGNSTEIIDQIFSVHTNTSIPDGKGSISSIRNQFNLMFFLILSKTGVLQRQKSNLIQSIWSIGNGLSQKHIFMSIKRVNNDIQKSTDLSLENKILFLLISLSNLILKSYRHNS